MTGPPGRVVTDVTGWHRLHPLSPLIRAGRQFLTIAIAVVVLFAANQRRAGQDLVIDLIAVGFVLTAGMVSWLVTRWQVAGGVLRIDTGLVRRQSRRFPLSQVQAIDLVQTGLARVLGLAEIRLRMAGSDAGEGRLACLPLKEAEQLRRTLLAMTPAAVTAPEAPRSQAAGPAPRTAGPAPQTAALPGGAAERTPTGPPVATGSTAAGPPQDAGRPLFRVRPGRLAVAIALSRTGALAAIVIAAIAFAGVTAGQPVAVASFLSFGIGIVLAVWRQYNGEYGTTVAAAPDGLRLRSGLVQTTAETIRPGRVQAVRLVEPWVWRAFGWCRLEVDIAGPRQRREDQSEARRLRALIPVGSRAEAERLLGELLPGRLVPSRPPPAVARWKAPLMYHFLAWDGDDRHVAAAHGRVSRKTTWVPLEKVQSFRWVQGPLQRQLGLASVRLDVAGRRVTASIQDRDSAEAHDILRRLPELARAARSQAA